MAPGQYSKMKVSELKAALTGRDRNPPLSTSGNKATLVARLEKDDAGESDISPEEINIITQRQLLAAGPTNDIYKWATATLCAEEAVGDNPPPAKYLGQAVNHPDLSILHTLLIEMRDAKKEMTPPNPPSLMAALEAMKDLIQNEMVESHVFSQDAYDMLMAFEVESVLEHGHEPIEESAQRDFREKFLAPIKQAQINWLSATIRKLEMEGPATKFPEHFDKNEIAALRAWAKAYIRSNELDLSKKLSDDVYVAALADEALIVERAKTLPMVTTILNQSAAAIKRDDRAKVNRRSSAGSSVGKKGGSQKGGSQKGGSRKSKKRKGQDESDEEELVEDEGGDDDFEMDEGADDQEQGPAGPSSRREVKRRRVLYSDED